MPGAQKNLLYRWLLALLFAAMAGCDSGESVGEKVSVGETKPTAVAPVETGDLDALKKRGELRILVPVNLEGGRYLPRKGSPVNAQQSAAKEFAASLGLKPRIVPAVNFADMIPMLLKGKGDLIAANLTVTDERKLLIAFSVPLTHVREQIVTRAEDTELKAIKDLEGRTVTVDPASSFWKTLESKRKKYPGIGINLVKNLRTNDVMDQVADGRIDVTVQDSNVMEMYLGFRDNLRVAFNISKDRPIAWGLRPDAVRLRDALNQFLHREQWTRQQEVTYRDDLPGLKKRKTLRVLLRNNAASYFLWKGELLGFEYELAREFARKQGLRLEIVVPPRHEDLLPWLLEGKGDIAAGFLTITEKRKAAGIAFSRPYHHTTELVVSRTGDKPRASEDLAGRTIAVRRSSPYWQTLEKLRANGIALQLAAAPEEMETEEIIAKVAEGKYDLTVADNHILDIELTWRDDVEAAFPLREEVSNAWAVRPENSELLKAVNHFFNQEYRGVFYNITYKKYFKNPRAIRAHIEQRVTPGKKIILSPYDELTRKYADEYGFDWRLLVSQMFQESRFNPKAESWAGALGLMQVMPRTAKQMGIHELKNPEDGIRAGVKYMAWLRERFEPDMPVANRMWFTLAAYNAGAGHVHDARRLARGQGLDGDRWFGNVEQAMLLLSKSKYAEKALHGYVRGREPVNYVRLIRTRYDAYAKLTEPVQTGREEISPLFQPNRVALK